MSDAIVQAARRWIGTPYHHQQSQYGVGTDCLGLIRGIWREVIGPEPEVVPLYSCDWGETGAEEILQLATMRHLIAKSLAEPALGDVILFRMRRGCIAKHLGVQVQIGAAPSFVHAYSGHCVTESPLSQAWARKIVARFQFPLER
jgi:NlpC/P60 family putative phage cell wall peptidase